MNIKYAISIDTKSGITDTSIGLNNGIIGMVTSQTGYSDTYPPCPSRKT